MTACEAAGKRTGALYTLRRKGNSRVLLGKLAEFGHDIVGSLDLGLELFALSLVLDKDVVGRRRDGSSGADKRCVRARGGSVRRNFTTRLAKMLQACGMTPFLFQEISYIAPGPRA